MSNLDSRTVVEQSIKSILEHVPALKPLKIIGAVEVVGRSDLQALKVEMPGPVVTKSDAPQALVRAEIRREVLNELASGELIDWIMAYESGLFRVSGSPQHLKLLGQVIIKQQARISRQTGRDRS